MMYRGCKFNIVQAKSNRNLLSIFCLLLLCITVLSGCSNDADGGNAQNIGHANVSKHVPVSLDVQEPVSKPSEPSVAAPGRLDSNNVITGKFICSAYNPLYSGFVEVTQLAKNKYHLNVIVVNGFSRRDGTIESDFSYDGQGFVLADPEYKQVNLSFTENSVTIDYEGDEFGGSFAEPKGTFYLKNSDIEDAPFLARLYNYLQLPGQYRNGFTDVLTYRLNDTRQVLLVRSQSSVDRSVTASEYLVVYNPSDKSFKLLGEIEQYNVSELRKKLEDLKAEPELIYELLRKDFADRLLLLKMRRFEDGDRSVLDPDTFKLTEEEAFYIVTGVEGTTFISNNTRDAQNIGSIFKTEVDSSDDKAVIVHIYEDVRNSEEDEHTATSDWLEVDRSTGKVVSSLYE